MKGDSKMNEEKALSEKWNLSELLEQKKAAEAENKAVQKKGYIVKVKNNPSFCGIGAGGVQFANGEAHITSDRMAEWFREHNGYEVTEA